MAILGNFGLGHAMAQGFPGAFSTTASNNKIEIYSGTMMSEADDWVVGGPGSPSNLLVTFSNFRPLNAPGVNATYDVQAVIFSSTQKPNPNPVNATATGTAGWYAMYDSAAEDGVLLGEVSVTGGTGTLQLDSVSLTSGNPVTITHWGLRFNM